MCFIECKGIGRWYLGRPVATEVPAIDWSLDSETEEELVGWHWELHWLRKDIARVVISQTFDLWLRRFVYKRPSNY